jgi:hypothetical protein
VAKKKKKTFHITVPAPTIIATTIAITITTTIKAPHGYEYSPQESEIMLPEVPKV